MSVTKESFGIWEVTNRLSKEDLLTVCQLISVFDENFNFEPEMEVSKLKGLVYRTLNNHPELCKAIPGYENVVVPKPESENPVGGVEQITKIVVDAVMQSNREQFTITTQLVDAITKQTQSLFQVISEKAQSNEGAVLKRAQAKKLGITTSCDDNTFSELESLLVSAKLSDEGCLNIFGDLCEGETVTWFKAHRPQFASYEQAKVSFLAAFTPTHNQLEIKAKILTTVQKSNESSEMFISKLLLQNRLLTEPFSEVEMLEILEKNLNSRMRTILGVREEPFTTLRRFERACKQAEEIQGESKVKVSSVAGAEVDDLGSETEIEINAYEKDNKFPCFNCGSNSHLFKNCSKAKQVFCHGCGKKGVVSAQCCYPRVGTSGVNRNAESVNSQENVQNETLLKLTLAVDELTKQIAELKKKQDFQ